MRPQEQEGRHAEPSGCSDSRGRGGGGGGRLCHGHLTSHCCPLAPPGLIVQPGSTLGTSPFLGRTSSRTGGGGFLGGRARSEGRGGPTLCCLFFNAAGLHTAHTRQM